MLAPKPEIAADLAGSTRTLPAESDAPLAVEDTPTLRGTPPVQEQLAEIAATEDLPTMRTTPEFPVSPLPQTPQPTPSASEFYNFAAAAPQGMSGVGTSPLPPLPGYSSGTLPAGAGFSQPDLAPGGGFYLPPTPMPGGPESGVFQPMYPGQPGWGASPGAFPAFAPAQQRPGRLINPMPTGAFITSILVVVVVLVALVFFSGSDWAAGFQTAGVVALVVGLLILIAFGVRAAMGMLVASNPHRRSQIISSVLLALIVFLVGAIGLTQQSAIHSVQAHILEGQQKWQASVNEYQSGGQNAPASEDIARTYNEWGELLLTQQQFSGAITKFNTVISSYDQATTGVARAQKDEISTYESWGSFNSQQQDYTSATQHYDALLNLIYCDSSCQRQANAADATAYYNLAEQQLTKQQYARAVTAFSQLTSRFSNSSEAQKVHGDYAKALWGEGQQQLTSTTCSSAITTYQQLSSQFADTPEGQQATLALKGPVQVKGQFTSTIPAASRTPVVILGTSTMTPNTTANQFEALFTNSPHTTINSDGTFNFASIPPGTYQFIWGTLENPDGFIRVEFLTTDTTIGVLCTYNFGSLPQTIPAS